MLTINYYCVPDNKLIQCDAVPIYEKVNDALPHIVQDLKSIEEDVTKVDIERSLCFRIGCMEDKNERVKLAMSTYRAFHMNEKHPKESDVYCKILFHSVMPDGDCFGVANFDKLIPKMPELEKDRIETLRSKVEDGSIDDILAEFKEKRANAKCTVDIICADTALAYVYAAMKGYMDENQDDIQEAMNEEILKVREENREDDFTNEYEVLVANIEDMRSMIKDDDGMPDEVQYCYYNGDKMDTDIFISILQSHKLDNYFDTERLQSLKEDALRTGNLPDELIKQDVIPIEMTMEDEYRVETNKLIIIRSEGGDLRIKRKEESGTE